MHSMRISLPSSLSEFRIAVIIFVVLEYFLVHWSLLESKFGALRKFFNILATHNNVQSACECVCVLCSCVGCSGTGGNGGCTSAYACAKIEG